jgi:toxin-antitoxin system PIN domain toxin
VALQVILIDANLLIYSIEVHAERHVRARAWLDAQLSGDSRVGLPWESLMAFLRITTNPRIFSHAQTVGKAWAQIEEWLDCDRVWIPTPGAAHRSIFAGLLANLGGGPRLIPDAHLAALAIEHGLTLCSSDGDFARFKGLRWLDPLAP